jgi:hypothetical protein
MDTPNIPAVPAAPAAAIPAPVTKTPAVEGKAPIDPKAAAPIDKAAADKIKAATPAEKEVIRKIKVGDQEFDESTLKTMIEKAKGADKKFLEAAQARKEAMRFFKMAKENPREFLEKTGVDPKKFSYDEVAKDIQEKLRPAHEVELEKAQARLKEFEAKEAAENERLKQEKLTKQAKALEERMHAQAIKALEAHPALPKNGFTVAKMAKYLEVVQQKTGELLSFEDVAGVIEADIRSEVRGIVKGATAEQLIELIGEEGAEMIRQYHLNKLKDPLKGNDGASGTADKPAQKKWANSHDFWKTIDKAAKAERGE